jgi:hypothetical protein
VAVPGRPDPAVVRDLRSMGSLGVGRPNMARVYDYWLGGKDNVQADRAAAEAIRERRPEVTALAAENKEFLTRAVGHVARHGVRQFLDVGSGLPTLPPRSAGGAPRWCATHEAAHAGAPDAIVAYVDIDPVAVMHSQARRASESATVVSVTGDMRDPAAITGNPDVLAAGYQPAEPGCVILGCTLHFLDAREARACVAGFIAALAPGSCLIISVGYEPGAMRRDFTDTYNAQGGARVYRQTREGIRALFDGLEVLPPGVVDVAAWHPEPASGPPRARPPGTPERAARILGGVGRTPARAG